MAEIFDSAIVQYLCSCGILDSLCYLYLCKYCLKLRCGNCVSHEVDSAYCSGCLEMMSITEAGHKKNRCSSCRVCPCCGHSLSTRATSVQSPSLEDPTKLVPKKVYYVACAFCRWTSRDSALPDQNAVSGCWSYFENEHAERLGKLQETYRALSAWDKAEMEKKRYPRPAGSRRFLDAKDKYGFITRGARKMGGITSARSATAVKEVDAATMEQLKSEPVDNVDEVSEDFITNPPPLTSVTSLEQRLMFVQLQPVRCADLQPQQKLCQLKRSLRCRYCEHNLSKPEYSAINTKFRIQLNAYYHVPDVKILRPVVLQPGVESEVILTFTNPISHQMPFWLEKYCPPDEEELRENPDPDNREASLLRVVTIERVEPDMTGNAEVIVPTTKFILSARDESAEFDDSHATSTPDVSNAAIVWRHGNKMAVRVRVLAHDSSGSDVIAPLLVNYGYTSAMIGVDSTSQRHTTLRARLLVNFGVCESV